MLMPGITSDLNLLFASPAHAAVLFASFWPLWGWVYMWHVTKAKAA